MCLRNKMIVGVTGGIGSGKSYVCQKLRDRGYEVFDCDLQAKLLMVTDSQVVAQITECVGKEAYINNEFPETFSFDASQPFVSHRPPERMLNKKAVAAFLFANPENAALINNIVHPRLAQVFLDWTRQTSGALIFMESAILFESGFNRLVDRTVCVFADDKLRIQRAMRRDNATYDQVRRRVVMQADQQAICARADYVIYNNDADDLNKQLDALIQTLLKEI